MSSTDLPFDLRQLSAFLAVCAAGTMAGAARRLQVSQPAISQIVAELEAATGATLFDRAVRPLGLTPAGAVLRDRAETLLADARQIAPSLQDAQAGRLPRLRIGLVDSLSRAVLPALIDRLTGQVEQVSFLAGLTEAHAAALAQRQLDVLLAADDLDDLAGLARHTLVEEPYILICPLAAAPPPRADMLRHLAARLPMARFSARSTTGRDIARHLRRLAIDLPPTHEFDTPFGVAAAVRRGDIFAITTPICLYEAGLDLAGIACLPLSAPGLRRRLTLIARQRELGRLPGLIAQAAKAALRGDCRSQLAARIPWAEKDIIWS